jgi:major membrane immunogen (membrane-anchored lipoprotein)
MKNKEMKVKAMSMAVAMSMVVGLCPSTIFAATGSQTAKDGTYTKTAHVTRTEDDSDDEWEEYDVEVSLKVEDGKFSEITVTPKEGYDEGNASYFNKAYSKTKGFKTKLEGQAATEDTINSWDTVSGATRTSDAIKKAALEAIQSAPVAGETVTIDTAKLESAIAAAEKLTESDYTADSWSAMQTKLTVAKAALKAKESQGAVDTAADELNAAVKALKKAEVAKETYVLMNIPYSEFYAADQVVGADSVSSATKAKTRSTLVVGSYHVNSDGTDITGITYPVKISDASVLKNYTQITDDSKLSITVNMKGKETTTEYNGKDAIFESASYSYYILSETPSYYKEATVNADGSLSFSEVKGATAQKLSDASIDFTTDTKYGDYELDVNGLPKTVNTVYGVVISTKEGDNYGLRRLENIWKKTELAWSTGFVTTSHGNTLDSKNYEKMMGQTINKITYYTDNGIYEIDADQYVPVKFNGTIAAENADVESGKVNVTVEGLPDDYQAEYTVEGLEDVQVKDGVLTYKTKGAEIGKYTLKVFDKSGKYADLTTDFELTTEAVPVVFNSESAALVAAEGYAAEDVTSYVKNIESVTVDGTEYAATGKRAVKIIKEDGTIDTTAAPFKNAENGHVFKISVKATGYAKDYEFTYTLSQESETITTTELEAAIAKAEALKEAEYTAESWASMQMELQEAKDELKNPKTQATVDEAVSHLNAAVEALVKIEEPAAVDTSSLEKVISDAAALKEADYTVDSWKALQSALTDAKSALNAKESQEKVDKATDALNAAIKALVKNGNQAGSQNGSATPTVTKKAGTTTDGSASKGTSGSKAAKTGDPANVLGLLGLAFSSLGAGVGGFAWKRKRK